MAVSSKQERIVEVVEANTEVFSDSLLMVDAQIHILQRVINDTLSGTVQLGGFGVDFGAYLGEYFAVQGLAGMLSGLKKSFPEESAIVAPDEDTVVFGGGF